VPEASDIAVAVVPPDAPKVIVETFCSIGSIVATAKGREVHVHPETVTVGIVV